MRVTTKQLAYLVAVADHRHFRKAAEASFVSQPALSAQIQQLELSLGVTLVERNRRNVMLTSVGEEVVARARSILRDLDDLSAAARRSAAPFSAPLSLGVIPTVAPYVIPRLLPSIRAVLPDLQLHLREEQTSRLLTKLRQGSLDIALLALPVRADNMEEVDLFTEEFVLVAPAAHGFPSVDVTASDLSEKTVLLLEEGHCLRDQALEICGRAGATENAAFRATSLGTLVQMVANGLGVTLLPRLAVQVELGGKSNPVALEFAPPKPIRRIGLIWRKHSARKEEIEMFVAAVQAQLFDVKSEARLR